MHQRAHARFKKLVKKLLVIGLRGIFPFENRARRHRLRHAVVIGLAIGQQARLAGQRIICAHRKNTGRGKSAETDVAVRVRRNGKGSAVVQSSHARIIQHVAAILQRIYRSFGSDLIEI